MLYPDLRRLAVVCTTGGTNDQEAGGSNDPLPPPASRARPGEGDEAPATAQAEALASEDILYSILLALVDGTLVDVCRAAARWCSLNKAHLAACDDGVWKKLTGLVFPDARAPNTGRIAAPPEPTDPKGWFFHLCTQHKQLGDLRNERWELVKKRVSTKDAPSRDYVKAAAKFAQWDFKRKLLLHILGAPGPPHLPDAIRHRLMVNIGRLQNEMAYADAAMNGARRAGARPTRQTVRTEDDERILRALSLQKTYLRDLYTDPEEQGPPTADQEIKRRRRLVIKVDQARDLALQAEREERERKRQERHDLAEQYRAWLAALNQMNPREAALSRLIGEADELIRRGIAEVTARGSTAKMKRIIARIAKERRARHTFASHPDLMGRLEGELARDVRFIKMAMNIPVTVAIEHAAAASDETVTVHDLFGSEGEDE